MRFVYCMGRNLKNGGQTPKKEGLTPRFTFLRRDYAECNSFITDWISPAINLSDKGNAFLIAEIIKS